MYMEVIFREKLWFTHNPGNDSILELGLEKIEEMLNEDLGFDSAQWGPLGICLFAHPLTPKLIGNRDKVNGKATFTD